MWKIIEVVGLVVIFLNSSARGLKGFAEIHLYCSGAIALIGGLMISGSTGPRRADDAHALVMIKVPCLEDSERQDREEGFSVGLITFASGVISGGVSYALILLSNGG